jgi:3-methyladenine DNA glycosylase Tag
MDSKFVECTNTQAVTTSRLTRWWETFVEYNVKFEHIKDQKNIVADALSRNTQEEERSDKMADTLHESMLFNASSHLQAVSMDKLKFKYEGDHEFTKTYKRLHDQDALVNGNV